MIPAKGGLGRGKPTDERKERPGTNRFVGSSEEIDRSFLSDHLSSFSQPVIAPSISANSRVSLEPKHVRAGPVTFKMDAPNLAPAINFRDSSTPFTEDESDDSAVEDQLSQIQFFDRTSLNRFFDDSSSFQDVTFLSFQFRQSEAAGSAFAEGAEAALSPVETTLDGRESFDDLEEESLIERSFVTPELPRGQRLIFHLLTTWGDCNYIGLMGIDMFDANGHPIMVSSVKDQVQSNVKDLTVVPQYRKDPRTIDKLFDGCNFTKDPLHSWMAPYTPGKDHTISIDFKLPVVFSMIRVWNYNVDRTHASCGVRLMEATLDDRSIFRGEIRRAPGCALSVDSCSECILFTMSNSILSLIEKYDKQIERPLREDLFDRPKTARLGSDLLSHQDDLSFPLRKASDPLKGRGFQPLLSVPHPPTPRRMSQTPSIVGQTIKLLLGPSWNDSSEVGLTGIQLMDSNGESLKLKPHQIKGPGDILNLIGDKVLTCSACAMWRIRSVPWTTTIEIDLQRPTKMKGLIVYNYNAKEETDFGARFLQATVDGQVVTPESGYLLRKAPGDDSIDYGQLLPFQSINPSGSALSRRPLSALGPLDDAFFRNQLTVALPQPYETIVFPQGFIFKFEFMSSWGDPFYIGLNGIQLFDESNEPIPLTEANIDANPRDINSYPDIDGDIRTLDKLIDGVNDTFDDHHMWLAPNAQPTTLFVLFDEIQSLSLVKLWNYSKTPSRGVKEFQFLVDDALVYRADYSTVDFAQSILFTNDPSVIEREQHRVPSGDEGIVFIDNNVSFDSRESAGRSRPITCVSKNHDRREP